jgi:hypothetical protein
MATTININISGYGVKTTTESSDTRHLLEYSERQWQEDNFYTLLPGFSPVGYLHGERKLKKKKKKNCTNGQVCGFSCISKTKTCIANMTTAQLKEHNKAKRLAAAEKRKAAKAAKAGGAGGASQPTNEAKQSSPNLIKTSDDPALKKFFGGASYRIDSAEVKVSKGDPVSIDSTFVERSLSELFFDKVAGKDYPAIDVSYDIDGAYDYTQRRLSGKEKIRVGRKAFSMMQDAVRDLPDGAILITAAYAEDGKGDYRARIYQKAGFGEANKRGTQFGIVVGGKIQPVTESELLKQVEES